MNGQGIYFSHGHNWLRIVHFTRCNVFRNLHLFLRLVPLVNSFRTFTGDMTKVSGTVVTFTGDISKLHS